MEKKILIIVLFAAFIVVSFLAVDHQASLSHGDKGSLQVIEIKPGENMFDIGRKLQDAGIVSWRDYFAYYVWKEDLRHSLVAGKYQLSGKMTIPEIAKVITQGDIVPKGVTIIFPEGFDSQKMADRLNANSLPGNAFLELVKNPKPEWRAKFWFLKDLPQNASLEGFLFPDTYTFTFETSADAIVVKMLSDFENRFTEVQKAAMEKQGKNIFDVVTLASIVENEVRNDADRKLVADLFLRRISTDMPLQSDATVKYVRGESKVQHSFEETRVDSPYNTYINKGLPPGPISNPGLESLKAVISPTPNPYFYFLNDTTTGETIFSTTFEEHVINKTKHGL